MIDLRKVIIVTAGCLFISACEPKVYDESYYSAHIEEAKEVVQKCESGDISGDNCLNAKTAINKANAKKWLKDFSSK